jgi:hypothetical protein
MTESLTFEEAVEELKYPTPGAILWARNAESNDLEGGWTGISGNVDAGDLDESDGPFVLTRDDELPPAV